jgi:hypothetical protein
MTRWLRFTAFAIAIAGVVDPAISLSGASRPRVAVVAQDPSSPASDTVRARLIRDLSSSYEIVPEVTSTRRRGPDGARYPDPHSPRAGPASTVTIPAAAASGVRIVRVDAPSRCADRHVGASRRRAGGRRRRRTRPPT